MDLKEYMVFLCIFFGLCSHACSLLDVLKHLVSYPLLTESLRKLNSPHHSLKSKINRINDLLHRFEGQSSTSQTNDTDNPNRCVFWKPVFGIKRELEKLFCDIGG